MKNQLSLPIAFLILLSLNLVSPPGHSQPRFLKNLKPISFKSSCTLPPIITCPLNFNSCPGVSTLPSNTGFATAKPGGVGCNQPIVSYTDVILSKGPCPGSTEINRTWTARDPQDNTLQSSCSQMIKLKDDIAPSITNCPPDVTVQANSNCQANVFWNPPSVSDNCGKLFLTVTHVSGDKFPIGVTRVSYTAEDVCGNSSTCAFDITVVGTCCNKPPILSCPIDYKGCPGDSILPKKTGNAIALPGSANCNTPILVYLDSVANIGPCIGAIEIYRKWKAVDPYDSNLVSSCTQKISLKDNIPPAFSNCPTDVTVSPSINCMAMVFWNLPTATDNCSTIKLSSNYNPGAFFNEGLTTVIYTASDACNNITQCSFHITVMPCCDKAPIISCPANYEACPGSSILPVTTGTATAIPGKSTCALPIISYVDQVISNGPCPGATKIERVWKAVDPNNINLFSSCTQIIELRDVMPPTFTSCPSDITVNTNTPDCKAVVVWNPPVATDNCGTVILNTNHLPGSIFEIGVTSVDYTASDACGNIMAHHFTITVINICCNKPPVLNCPVDYEACPGSSILPSSTGQATAQPGSTNCSLPNLSYTDIILSTGPCSGAQKIKRVWKAVDPNDSNLISICSQIIELRDVMPPTFISCPSNITVNTNTQDCRAVVQWAQPNVIDNCGIPFLTSNYSSGATFDVGVTTIVYIAIDGCGNKSSHMFTITVISTCCNKPPNIKCPPDYSSCPTSAYGPGNTGYATATASSPGCSTPVITYKDSILGTWACKDSKKLIRIWKATDPSTNLYSTCQQLIELMDKIPPIFKYCSSDIYVDLHGDCDKIIKWDEPITYDNCSIVTLSSNYHSGQTFGPGVYHVIYTATDACGNYSTHSFTITVVGGGIKINCPGDIVVNRSNPNISGEYVSWQLPTVKQCGTACDDSVKQCMYVGSYNGHKYFCSRYQDTWLNAKAYCQNAGGYLCVINDSAENNFIKNKIMGATAYIGLHDLNVEGKYEWVDGTPFSYSNWYPGQPNNANNDQDVCEILPDGSWNDQYASTLREFICELPCYEIKQIEGPANGSLFPCGTTKVSYVAIKGNAKDTCSFYVTVNCNSNNSGYCSSRGLESKYMWIQCVQLSNINNCSGNNGGYGDFTNLCVNLKLRNTYQLCLTPGFAGSTYQVYWKVWIDYNEDNDFEDQGEFVAYGTGNSVVCGDITLPAYCSCPSIITRMRVSMAYGGYPNNSCCQFTFGEVEDYCVAIGAGLKGVDGRSKVEILDAVPLHCQGDCKTKNQIPLDVLQQYNGLGEIKLQNESVLSVYPNPASDRLSVQLNQGNIEEIQLFSILGKQIVMQKYQGLNSQQFLLINEIQNGNYILVVTDDQGKNYMQKLSIAH